MRKLLFSLVLFVSTSAFTQNTELLKPVISVSDIQKNYESWQKYEKEFVNLSADFKAIDSLFQIITKREFLEKLISRNYLPLKMDTKDSSLLYQLIAINKKSSTDIGTDIKYKAMIELKNFKMEGLPLPDFNFVDLENHFYSTETAKGKIVLIKCWFINCVPCVAEMPRLNKLVNDYKERNDLLFLSLAFDKADRLKNFLQKTVFNYRIIPEKEAYLLNTLSISGYPTHIIINREGLVLKVSENLDDIINVLKIELAKEN